MTENPENESEALRRHRDQTIADSSHSHPKSHFLAGERGLVAEELVFPKLAVGEPRRRNRKPPHPEEQVAAEVPEPEAAPNPVLDDEAKE